METKRIPEDLVALGRQLSARAAMPSLSVYDKHYIVTNACSPFAYCSCPDWAWRHLEKRGQCKHVLAVRDLIGRLYDLAHDSEQYIVDSITNTQADQKIRRVERVSV